MAATPLRDAALAVPLFSLSVAHAQAKAPAPVEMKQVAPGKAEAVRKLNPEYGFDAERFVEAIGELRELGASLRRFSEALERNPGMLLQGRPAVPPGPGE